MIAMEKPTVSAHLNSFEAFIDIQKIDQLRSFMDEEQLRSIYSQFFSGEKSGICRLKHAIDLQDLSDVQYQAHSIKGAAAFLGLKRIVHYCEFLEKNLSQEELLQSKEICEQLEIVWNASIVHTQSIHL